MRERVEACGGSLTVESDLNEGTTVVIAIPLSHEEL
jgi:signal transduction histidine kinase